MRIAHGHAAVEVPATSANLGPGFDALGLALRLRDRIEIEAIAGADEVHVEGEGADSVPRDADHLVLRALRAGLDHAGAPHPGIRMRCRNVIPHGRGLGSSAAAVVGGLMLARGLLADPSALGDDAILDIATRFEGHPDNAAPALFGGATIAWTDGGTARAVRLALLDDEALAPVVLAPASPLATAKARGALPAEVAHADAAFNVGRSALLVHALGADASLLLAATEDRLHQSQRAAVMPETVELVRVLRSEGYAATVSGAGPSVLVLGGADEHLPRLVSRVVSDPRGWRTARVGVDRRGAVLLTSQDGGRAAAAQ